MEKHAKPKNKTINRVVRTLNKDTIGQIRRLYTPDPDPKEEEDMDEDEDCEEEAEDPSNFRKLESG